MPEPVTHAPRGRQEHRLRKHADYQRVYRTGRKQFGKQMGYFFAAQPPGLAGEGPRVGLTVPKALGKAVDRNRIKRRLRVAVRAGLPLLTSRVDVVLHPRRSVLTGDFDVLVREVGVIFRSVEAAAQRGLTANMNPRPPRKAKAAVRPPA